MNARMSISLAAIGALTVLLVTPAVSVAQAAAEAAKASTMAPQAQKKPGAAANQAPVPPPPTPVMQPVGPTIQDASNDLSVTVGKSVVLDLAKPIRQIVMGLGDFAEAQAVSPTQVLVNGKAVGETTLIIWDASGTRQFFNVTVRPSNYALHDQLESTRRQIRTELPGQDVSVAIEGPNVFLRGTVDDLTAANRAVLIASTAGKVVNLLNVKVPEPERQILLKVRFAAVDRSKEKDLGMNLFSTGAGNTIGTVSTGQFTPPSITSTSSGATATISDDLNLFAYYPGIDLGVTIKALEQKGIVESLAEPNILAANGKQASFLAGGEYPFPMVQGGSSSGGISISFKEYGIRLNFLPKITARGTIDLQLSAEVSALDFADSITVSGYSEPALTVRRVKNQIELADRQSFAVGGLLNNTDNETFEKIPFLGDIPILGKFFQTMKRVKSNTELIVIVTPEIVTPVPAGTEIAAPKLPEPFLPPNSNTPMHTPDNTPAEAVPAPAAMPIEKLIESMKPGAQLSDPSGGSTGSSGGGGSTGASTGTP